MSLINCKGILTWPESCVGVSTKVANQGNTFTINETKLHVPVIN